MHLDLRLAGEGFARLMGNAAGTFEAEALAARLLAAFETPFTLAGENVPARAAIGTALCPDHASAEADLRHCADLAQVLAHLPQAGGRIG